MNTLSLRENRQEAAQTDRLCHLIESHAPVLRSAGAGKRFKLEGVRFQLYCADRNTVYRVKDGSEWFLKMPRSGNPAAVEREIIGAQAVRETLTGSSGYQHPRVVRASTEHGYLLTARIKGTMLNRALYRSSYAPLPWLRRRIEEAFANLGRVLALLHGRHVQANVFMNRPVSSGLHGALEKVTRSDQVCELIRRHFGQPVAPIVEQGLSHGNLHLQNVIAAGRQVSIIDFENCGRGSIYADLSLVCAQLTYTTATVHVRSRRLAACKTAFLAGYREHRDYDPVVLNQATVARVAHYYLDAFCGNKGRPTIGGIPVSRRRVRRLVETLLRADGESAVNDISTVAPPTTGCHA
ncbi:MAG: phosphotransferase [Planctomycetota bacterium]